MDSADTVEPSPRKPIPTNPATVTNGPGTIQYEIHKAVDNIREKGNEPEKPTTRTPIPTKPTSVQYTPDTVQGAINKARENVAAALSAANERYLQGSNPLVPTKPEQSK